MQVAVEAGTMKAEPGHGEFVPREPYPAVNKALSTWKELTAPRRVERKAENIPAGV